MFGITLFDALLFKVILPRQYQIFEDRLRILMGGPFAINIFFSSIVQQSQLQVEKPSPMMVTSLSRLLIISLK